MSKTDGSANESEWLVLVPTQLERATIAPLLGQEFPVELCGFGPVASAAKTSQLLHQYNAEKVLLVGIAGGYTDEMVVGKGYRFSTVSCDGVGAGQGSDFLSSGKMGWNHWSSDEMTIGDSIQIESDVANLELLTVCAASSDGIMVSQRQSRFPNAVAEDMEGFAVAVACKMHNKPLTIVRGISNRAGDRDKANWQIKTALEDAAKLSLEIMGQA